MTENAAKKRDPRLDELREMGLQRAWLEVAEAIGVDAFLQTWRILDQIPSQDDGRMMIPLRRYSCFERYQRNRFIEALADLGFTHDAIRGRLMESLGTSVSVRHIARFGRKTGG